MSEKPTTSTPAVAGSCADAQPQGPQTLITVVAKGRYNHPTLPEPLAEALAAEVQSHMRGYGITETEVRVFPNSEDYEGLHCLRVQVGRQQHGRRDGLHLLERLPQSRAQGYRIPGGCRWATTRKPTVGKGMS